MSGRNDPNEKVNLAGRKEYCEVADGLRKTAEGINGACLRSGAEITPAKRYP
jgi:hypothetical protein